MGTRKGAEYIVDRLVAEGVPYVFGLCGHGIIGFLDAVYDRQDELKAVTVHHESSAGFMADAYYRVAQRPVATFTSCGPGSLNLPVAVASAFMDSSAMLCITGNVPTQQWNRGPFQETGRYFQGDFVNVMRPYVKRSFQPTRADMLPIALEQAFALMRNGKPGPVHVDVPLNVFVETLDVDESADSRVTQPVTAIRAPEDAIAQAWRMLSEAERPVIVAGHGVELSGAEAALLEFARAFQIPVAFTPLGKGVIDMREPLALGTTGRNGTLQANAATRNADVILALGTRFDDRATSAWLPGFTYSIPPTRLIHVDVDPSEIGRNFPVALGIVGDARLVLEQLTEFGRRHTDDRHGHRRDAWLERIQGWRAKWEAHWSEVRTSDAEPIRPERVVHDLRRAIPDDGILLCDVGVHHNWIVADYQAYRPRTVLQSWGFASMGFAVAGVVGAKLAAPDRPAVALCGDAGFLMLPSAVATAVEYGTPVVWVVWNNSGFGSIRDQQMGYFGQNRELVTSFVDYTTGRLYSPEYAEMARSMGADGVRVDAPGDFGVALEQALCSGRPTVIDVRVDREIKPPGTGSWDLPPLPHPLPNFGWGEDWD